MSDQKVMGAEASASASTTKKISTPKKKAASTSLEKQPTAKPVKKLVEKKEAKKDAVDGKGSIEGKVSAKKTPVKKTPAKADVAVKLEENLIVKAVKPKSGKGKPLVAKKTKEVIASSDAEKELAEILLNTKSESIEKVIPSKEIVKKDTKVAVQKISSPKEDLPVAEAFSDETATATLPKKIAAKKAPTKSIAKPVKPIAKKNEPADEKALEPQNQVMVETSIGTTEVSAIHNESTETLKTVEAIAEESLEQAAQDILDSEAKKNAKRRSRSRRGRGKKTGDVLVSEVEDQTSIDTQETDDEGETESHALEKQKNRELLEQKLGRRKMFVSVQPDEQVEVVISEEGQVQEYYVEMLQQAKTKGNIYKAVIHNVDPNLQAAFINYGAVKNGFLQIDEVHPEYYNIPHDSSKSRKYPPIQKALKPGQELLVQIVKEPTGNKGAFLTTYLSLPGRFLVLTPGREQIGVSRKVDNDEERSRLRDMLEGLSPGTGLGVIVRTVSMGMSKSTLQKDMQNLKKIWKDVRQRGTLEKSPCQIYQEMDLTTRAVRDYLTDQVVEVWIDDEKTTESITDLAGILFPKKKNLVRLHKDESIGLFERFNIQKQLDQIHSREVVLPSGGRLVIDPTEALTAIDINSGRSGGKNNFEDMAYRTNMEAAKMIPLQLRLRDIGGQIVADFIEMREKSHWREVEKALRAGMKVDRARYDVGKIGPFGMLEIVRQRLGSSAISVSTEICPHCKGTGVRKNLEWQSQQALKDIQRQIKEAQSQGRTELIYETEAALALHLLNNKRQRIYQLEQAANIVLEILPKV